MMFTILVVDSHKDPFQLRSLRLYHRCLFFAIPEPLTFLFQSNLLYVKPLVRRYQGNTKRRSVRKGLMLQTRLEKARERAESLGLCRLGQDLEGGCFFWHCNDGRGLRGLFLHALGVALDPQRKKISGGKHSGPVGQRGWPQQDEHKALKRSSLKGILKEVLKQFPRTKWLSVIRKDYGFLSLLGVFFSVSFKLPPLNLLYQIFPYKQIESY